MLRNGEFQVKFSGKVDLKWRDFMWFHTSPPLHASLYFLLNFIRLTALVTFQITVFAKLPVE